MFKKLNDMENKMCDVMRKIKDSNNTHYVLNNLCQDDKNALHECIKNKYIENISEYADGNGCYHFQSLGNTYINQLGFTFMQNMSIWFRLKNALFDILKGTLGFLLGVATTLSVNAVIWMIGHPEEIQEFLCGILHK